MTEDAQAVKLYLDDLTVGQRFTSPSHVMELDEIREFAGRYDPQFFHLDEELARDSLFGKLAASGWHTAAATMGLSQIFVVNVLLTTTVEIPLPM